MIEALCVTGFDIWTESEIELLLRIQALWITTLSSDVWFPTFRTNVDNHLTD
jgi:hypothetical protein